MMTFSEETKQELIRIIPKKECCILSALNGFTQSLASLTFHGGGEFSIKYITENPSTAKLIFSLLKNCLSHAPVVQYGQSPRFGGRRLYSVIVQRDQSKNLLHLLQLLRKDAFSGVFKGIPRTTLQRHCCQTSFLRAWFIATGSISNPDKSYHLSFSLTNTEHSHVLSDILYKCGLIAKETTRRANTLLYFKKSQEIGDFLTLIGANTARLKLENAQIVHQLRGQANRIANCDSANVNKQIAVATRQMNLIKAYSLDHGLSSLPSDLQEIAELRLHNAAASLEELGSLLTPPLGKSGANHRMRKLMNLLQKEA